MRVTGDPAAANNGLFYIHSDHLGSTSVLTKYSDGYIVSSSLTRYTPFGGYRTGGPSQITDRAFTGQKENMALGLYYYNARYYLPGAGRFLSADTIVPDPQNPQSFNRYSYVLNRPLSLTDPSGHCPHETVCIIGGSSGNLEDIELLQRSNAVTNVAMAWPASIASNATIVKRVNGLAPISQGPLNEIKILPNGSFVRVTAPVATMSKVASYGLPAVTGVINQIEIRERSEIGQISAKEAKMETVSNGVFTLVSVGAGGYALPAIATAAEAPVALITLAGVSLGYDLTVAQSTINNMIEGQDLSAAFWNARATTNDRFTFGHGQKLEENLNKGAAFVADAIIMTSRLFDN